ncbi:metalloregulator ArsR/SmtB family transcription factor [Lactobacillus sp. ESL0684]|uniref:ArsR/SmtB family transcription factor n=1 Tax=Lactobacillus sp. ESL0684 TaxID=2983213 RepID=UPI0023FA213E|nr:metalloregulator ArsR/SmtB family transcription factor [Lactobacillus sp. ESL0684]WEV43920.1 metalloregulator ArsR/SmtB family transcription factor [Lactobacillus sp. ESL0684]
MAMAQKNISEEQINELTQFLKALSNPIRLKILIYLQEPRRYFPIEQAIADPDTVGVCVTQIQEKVNLAQSTVSSYMATLERANLVISTRVGKWTHYKRNEQQIQKFTELLSSKLLQ